MAWSTHLKAWINRALGFTSKALGQIHLVAQAPKAHLKKKFQWHIQFLESVRPSLGFLPPWPALFLPFLSLSFAHFLPSSRWLCYHITQSVKTLLLCCYCVHLVDGAKVIAIMFTAKKRNPWVPRKIRPRNGSDLYSLYLLVFKQQPCPLIVTRLSLSLQLIYVLFSYSYTCLG